MYVAKEAIDIQHSKFHQPELSLTRLEIDPKRDRQTEPAETSLHTTHWHEALIFHACQANHMPEICSRAQK